MHFCCVCCVLYRQRHLRQADHSFRGVLAGFWVGVLYRILNIEASYVRVGLSRHRKNIIMSEIPICLLFP
jgi:hypothetical protein